MHKITVQMISFSMINHLARWYVQTADKFKFWVYLMEFHKSLRTPPCLRPCCNKSKLLTRWFFDRHSTVRRCLHSFSVSSSEAGREAGWLREAFNIFSVDWNISIGHYYNQATSFVAASDLGPKLTFRAHFDLHYQVTTVLQLLFLSQRTVIMRSTKLLL